MIILLFFMIGLVILSIKGLMFLSIQARIGLLLFLVVSILSVKAIKGFIPFPIGIRHIFHLIVAPEDLYQPIITDSFIFHEKDFVRTYLLQPKYFDIYELGFSIKEGISSKYKFKGKILVEFLWKDRLLDKKVITSINSAGYFHKDMTKYKSVSLLNFEIPFQGKYKDDISMKITVLESDQELKQYRDSIKLYIAVSAIP